MFIGSVIHSAVKKSYSNESFARLYLFIIISFLQAEF